MTGHAPGDGAVELLIRPASPTGPVPATAGGHVSLQGTGPFGFGVTLVIADNSPSRVMSRIADHHSRLFKAAGVEAA